MRAKILIVDDDRAILIIGSRIARNHQEKESAFLVAYLQFVCGPHDRVDAFDIRARIAIEA